MNNGKVLYYNADTSTDEEEQIFTNNYVVQDQLFDLQCSKCHEHNGSYILDLSYSVKVRSLTIPKITLESIAPTVEDTWYIKFHCPNCNADTEHYVVDNNMGDVIKVLNRDCGIKTIYCCEGHSISEVPYIMFQHDSPEKFFDMNDQLLRYFILEKHGKEDGIWNLYLDFDKAPISYYLNNEFIDDLYNYIIKTKAAEC